LVRTGKAAIHELKLAFYTHDMILLSAIPRR